MQQLLDVALRFRLSAEEHRPRPGARRDATETGDHLRREEHGERAARQGPGDVDPGRGGAVEEGQDADGRVDGAAADRADAVLFLFFRLSRAKRASAGDQQMSE